MLVHHADTVGPDVDPQRPLSALGLEQARRLADQAVTTGFVPAAIWHSGKLRARQTAEAFLRLSPFAQFKMINGIRPEDPPEMLLDVLDHETRDVLVASHMPYLPELLQQMVPGAAMFPLHGFVLLERTDDGWKEITRA
jgi:phosphohistidine phosphatase